MQIVHVVDSVMKINTVKNHIDLYPINLIFYSIKLLNEFYNLNMLERQNGV